MSLRRRIAAAAAVAVAAVALAVVVTSYLTTRAHLINQVKDALTDQAEFYLAPHPQDHAGGGASGTGQPGAGGRRGGEVGDLRLPPQPVGGAEGVIQTVSSSGEILNRSGPRLPVNSQVLRIARARGGSAFFTAHVGSSRTHFQIFAAWDDHEQHVVMIGLSLSDTDEVLHGLLLPYVLLIAGGVLLAAVLGLAISRSALRPIERFVARTERVTQKLDRPARLEETDAIELRRLAMSFNQTIDALEHSIEAQRHLVADASHELRTPISALRSNVQIFLDAERLPAGEREELQASILAELDELTQIVADVMELARGSGPDLQPVEVELDTIVREVVERTQRRWPNLSFSLELEPTVIHGVPDRISRAVANVVDNARKWSPPEGEIDIRLRDGIMTVRDHGPGFGEKDLPHVFDRFYRAPGARRMPGSGLGLSIVRQAAEGHGGHAEAANAPGGGAVVTVSFGPPTKAPRSPEPAVAAPPEPAL